MKHPKLGRAVPANESADIPEHLEPFRAVEAFSLLELEPPQHSRLRRVAMRGFDRAKVAAMAPEISRIADRLIDDLPEGPFDLIEHFCHPFPALVITGFLGVPQDMASQLQAWSNAMVAMYQVRRNREIELAASAAARDFASYLRDFISHRDAATGTGFLPTLLQAQEAGEVASEDELISSVVLLLNAGHEASVHTLGHAVNLLATNPERALELEPVNIAETVEECLRFAPPLHMFTRHVYEDTRILGQDFEAGQEVGCLLGSACHDDAVWPDGDRFNPFRARRASLAFGSGIHVCLGASLARTEMQVALPILFSRCPTLRIMEPPRLADRYHFHGLERLMVSR